MSLQASNLPDPLKPSYKVGFLWGNNIKSWIYMNMSFKKHLFEHPSVALFLSQMMNQMRPQLK